MCFGCWLRLRAKLAVGLDIQGRYMMLGGGRWCLDGSIVTAISVCFVTMFDKDSPYTSAQYTLFVHEVRGKTNRRVNQSARDSVTLMTFPCAMLIVVHTLNASGSAAGQ